jgi:SOS-response transcriptional repressor LexA
LIKTKLSSRNGNCIALLSDEDIKPIFKKGSLFIVDTLAIPEDGNLVAIDIKNENTILIRKLLINKNKKILISFDEKNKEIELSKKIDYRFIGVVIQVNAKT